jgi:hypothetical protein
MHVQEGNKSIKGKNVIDLDKNIYITSTSADAYWQCSLIV